MRRDPQDADGVGAVRLREGRVHRRHQLQAGPLRARRRRHAVPRRDRRDPGRDAGQAAARDPGERVRAGRRAQDHQGRRPADHRHQPRPRAGDRARQLPRRPVLPPQRGAAADPAAAQAPQRHPAAGPPHHAEVQRAAEEERRRRQRRGAGGAGRAPVAGQHPRARERPRADDPVQQERAHRARRPAGGDLRRRGRGRGGRAASGATGTPPGGTAAVAPPRPGSEDGDDDDDGLAGEVAPELSSDTSLKDIVRAETERIERDLIARALSETGGNVTQAAKLLKISRKSLQMKMKELGLRDPEPGT
ncbi:MAG: hypothetical protein H6709_15320 [Kofleriaceae bacterium]|nr:hypothetical protein [Kofleriaceae bacterium]